MKENGRLSGEDIARISHLSSQCTLIRVGVSANIKRESIRSILSSLEQKGRIVKFGHSSTIKWVDVDSIKETVIVGLINGKSLEKIAENLDIPKYEYTMQDMDNVLRVLMRNSEISWDEKNKKYIPFSTLKN